MTSVKRRQTMKKRSIGAAVSLAASLVIAAVPSPGQDIGKFASTVPGPDQAAFVFLGYSAVLIRTADQVIAVDPAHLLNEEDMAALKSAGLKLVLYTHGHGDHFSPPTALGIFKATGAVIAAEPGVASQLRGKIPADKLITAETGKSFTVGKIAVDCVAGEHIGPIVLFRIRIGDIAVFHGGDSNSVPLTAYPSRLAFLPTGQPSPTASPEAALRMASDLKPGTVVVFHGSDAQHAEFKEKMKSAHPDVQVIVPEPGKMMTVTLRK
jgi:L-ascorbate metabolism protein UlaG (beta-lactamase superfamily)